MTEQEQAKISEFKADGPPSTEREEAFWCEIVLLRMRITKLDADNKMLREHIELTKQVHELKRNRPTTSANPQPAAGKRLTEEQKASLILDCKRGESPTIIARKYGVAEATVHSYKRKYCIGKERP